MRLAQILVGILFLWSLTTAVSTQTALIISLASEVEKLVDVESDFSLEKLVPGSEYKASLRVKFAIAGESLKNFNEEKITVNVVAKGAREDSWIYFRGVDGRSVNKFKNVFFKLECVVKNNACGGKSVLEKNVPVFYFAPGGLPEGREDGVTVEASLKSFREQELLAQAEEKMKELTVVSGAAGGSSARQRIEAADAVLEKAREAGGDDGSALQSVETALKQGEIEQRFFVEDIDETAGNDLSAQPTASLSPLAAYLLFARDNSLLGVAVLAVAAVGAWYWRRKHGRKTPFQNG